MAMYARGNPARWWRDRRIGGGSRAPLGASISPTRRALGITALLSLSAIIGGVWWATNPTRLSALSQVLLSRILGGHVKVASAHLSWSGTLLLQGVELDTPAAPGTLIDAPQPAMHLFAADQIEARFDWTSLLLGRLRATQLTAERPTLYLVQDLDTGRWNYEKLHGPSSPQSSETRPASPPPAEAALPVILLRDARIAWGEDDHAGDPIHDTGTTLVDGRLTPAGYATPVVTSADGLAAPPAIGGYTFEIQQRLAPRGDSPDITPAPNALAADRLTVAPPGAPANAASAAVITGSWNIATGRFSATIDGLELGDALKSALPRSARDFWDAHHLHGKISHLQLDLDNASPSPGLQLAIDIADLSCSTPITIPSGLSQGEVFPLDVHQLHGRIVLAGSGRHIEIHELAGQVLGQDFIIDGQLSVGDVRGAPGHVDWAAAGYTVHAHLPTLNLRGTGADHAAYPELLMALEPVQDALMRVEPRGPMDFSVTVTRAPGPPPPPPATATGSAPAAPTGIHVDGDVICHGAGMRFVHFPYPLTDMEGDIHFDENLVRFQNVHAKAGETDVIINGASNSFEKNPFIDFTVSSQNAVFDERMAACLPEKYANVWDNFSMRGTGALTCRVTHDRGSPSPVKVAVTVDVADGAGYMKAMPYPFFGAHGRLVFASDESRVENIVLRCGDDGSGQLTLNGIVRHPGGDVENLRPELTIVGAAPIDASLLHAIPVEYASSLGDAQLAGRIAFNGAYRRLEPPPGSPDPAHEPPQVEITGAIALTDGQFSSASRHLNLSRINGETVLMPGSLQVKRATADAYGLSVGATGSIDLLHSTGQLALTASAVNFPLPAALPPILPDSAATLWKQYVPTGKVDLDASANLAIGWAPGAAPFTLQQYAAKILAKGVGLHSLAWPEDIQDLSGEVVAAPGSLQMHAMSARTGPVKVLWDGTYDTTTGACSISGAASSDGPPGRWISMLPTGVRSFLTTYKIGGAFDATVSHLERPAADKDWAFSAVMGVKNFTMEGAAPIKADTGTASIDGTLGAQGASLKGKLAAGGVTLSGKTIDSFTASLLVDPKDKSLKVDDIDGHAAGGRLQGSVTGSFDGEGRYEASVVLSDANLWQLLLPPNASADERAKVGEGHVTATLSIQQTFGAAGERTGRGELAVTDGVLYNVPLAMGLLQVATLRLPVSHSFDGASMTYYLRDNQVSFEKIILQSKGINLAGNGTLSLANKGLDMHFVTESPKEWNIPIISTIVKEARNQLLELSVTGTVDNPKVTPVPLSGITATLRTLLPIPK